MSSAEKAATDQANGNAGSEESKDREQSTIVFPYMDLDEAVGIAKGIHGLGGSCETDQLAAHLNQSPKSSGFRVRLATAKIFNLMHYEKGGVRLADLGIKICDSQQEARARCEAFLAVPLYKAVYDKYKGASLPPETGLEAAMVSLGVAQKVKDKARQTFQRSARKA